jgi:hypothetical protein
MKLKLIILAIHVAKLLYRIVDNRTKVRELECKLEECKGRRICEK